MIAMGIEATNLRVAMDEAFESESPPLAEKEVFGACVFLRSRDLSLKMTRETMRILYAMERKGRDDCL